MRLGNNERQWWQSRVHQHHLFQASWLSSSLIDNIHRSLFPTPPNSAELSSDCSFCSHIDMIMRQERIYIYIYIHYGPLYMCKGPHFSRCQMNHSGCIFIHVRQCHWQGLAGWLFINGKKRKYTVCVFPSAIERIEGIKLYFLLKWNMTSKA